ncbi:MAG: hypothetical protein K6E37_06515 [Bacteroidales bacterium]|nr:hypothetical protein [Bacteroidales bacterium]
MNTKRTTMGWLVLAAALIIGMTACSKEENLTEEPTTAAGVQVTVSAGMDDGAMTRADVTEAVVEGKTQRTLKFTAGDRLYIWRYKDGHLNGILTMDGEPTADGLGARFSGTLKAYDGENNEITDYDYTSLGSDPLTGSKAILIPSGAAAECFDEANHRGLFKEQYSMAADVNTLMKTALYVAGDYNGSGYTLTKRYPILNCNLGGLTAGTTYSVTLGFTPDQSRYENSGIDIFSLVYTPTIIADGDGNVRFAISGGNDLLGYNFYWVLRLHAGMFNYDYIIGQKQFEVKVYNVTRATPNVKSIVAAVGQVIGSDGNKYDYASLPSGVTAVAKICYNDGGHCLALALADEGQMDWSSAVTTCAAHTPTIPGGTWKLASKDEWDQMINASGGYAALRDGFESVGGTNMQSTVYWSSTEGPVNTIAYRYIFSSGDWDLGVKSQDGINVRACLTF